MGFFFFVVIFHENICFYHFHFFFEEVLNFRNRILINKKLKLVIRNYQWNCMPATNLKLMLVSLITF